MPIFRRGSLSLKRFSRDAQQNGQKSPTTKSKPATPPERKKTNGDGDPNGGHNNGHNNGHNQNGHNNDDTKRNRQPPKPRSDFYTTSTTRSAAASGVPSVLDGPEDDDEEPEHRRQLNRQMQVKDKESAVSPTVDRFDAEKGEQGEQDEKSAGDPDDRIQLTTARPFPLSDQAEKTEKNLVGKIDRRVIPFLCLMYMMAFLDRVNISNANSFGLSDELGLTTHNEYNISLVIFSVPYILLEMPSNYVLRRVRPNYWLGGCMILFGLTTLLQGLVRTFSTLLVTRFFLGISESGMFPGAFYLIGMWYRRHEAQKRFSFFFSTTTLAGAFGGLFASMIGLLDGHLNMRGWRWIFLIEGCLTTSLGFVCLFFLPTFPEDAHWLTPAELELVRARIRSDQGAANDQSSSSFRDAFAVLRDPKVVLGGFMYFGLLVPSYSFAYFAPGIIKSDYGFSNIDTQLYAAPPWAVACVVAMVVAYLSDRVRNRFYFVVSLTGVAAAGFVILLSVTENKNVQYAAMYLVTIGLYSIIPMVICWYNMNLGGHLRRSIGSAWQISFGNIGGIVAGFSFLANEAPFYRPGYSVCLAFLCFSACVSTAYWYLCRRANMIRDKAAVGSETVSEEERGKLGDLSPDYRYLL